MSTLHIEHSISDFDTWNAAFTKFADQRHRGGVLTERVAQPVDNRSYVIIDLEFATIPRARAFLEFLETKAWSSRDSSPALVGTPQTRIW